MKTQIDAAIADTNDGREAAEIIGSCVHCGFCTATCPTYQLLGDELDGPRGRIYLIKQVLEGKEPTARTQSHLDRCLTCRSCETTCPSGVQYGRLVDIGRKVVENKVPRPIGERVVRAALRHGLTSSLFKPALRLGQALRPVLPAQLRSKIPARQSVRGWPDRSHARKMLAPLGCVQPAMAPDIDAAMARVLDAVGVQLVTTPSACCGAIKHHLSDSDGALQQARNNIDAWWPHVQAGIEAIIINASGCGAMVKEYAHLLRHDAAYAEKAARIVAMTRDPAEVLPEFTSKLVEKQRSIGAQRVVFHPPCTLQHAQKIRGSVEAMLSKLGATVLPLAESHLCCGSAGTYSLLQPKLSSQLRERKLAALTAQQPEQILSANIGCISHLAAGTELPVRHWIQWLDATLPQPESTEHRK